MHNIVLLEVNNKKYNGNKFSPKIFVIFLFEISYLHEYIHWSYHRFGGSLFMSMGGSIQISVKGSGNPDFLECAFWCQKTNSQASRGVVIFIILIIINQLAQPSWRF